MKILLITIIYLQFLVLHFLLLRSKFGYHNLLSRISIEYKILLLTVGFHLRRMFSINFQFQSFSKIFYINIRRDIHNLIYHLMDVFDGHCHRNTYGNFLNHEALYIIFLFPIDIPK